MVEYKMYSVRMDVEIYREVKRIANEQRRSINKQIILYIEKGLEQEEQQQERGENSGEEKEAVDL